MAVAFANTFMAKIEKGNTQATCTLHPSFGI